MFNRKLGWNQESFDPNQTSNLHGEEEPLEVILKEKFSQQRYFNSPEIKPLLQNMNAKPKQDICEEADKHVSATTKALHQMEVQVEDVEKQKNWKKTTKIPSALKKKKINKRLSRLLVPKNALILLHELKPGCIFKVQEQPGSIHPCCFTAKVEHKDVVLGIGQGSSKSQAKNAAAEKAIKEIITKIMTKSPKMKAEETDAEELTEENMEESPENLPWAGIASFAIFKMFSEWQNDGTDVPFIRPVSRNKIKPPNIQNGPVKKDLPLNAVELHPAVVLNTMFPGLIAVELEREDGPRCRVKMGYSIDGKMFTGIGGNKKDAKKEAAKAVLKELYGLTYPD